MPDRDEGKQVNLPPRIFLYTLDQISEILSIPLPHLRRSYVYFHGRSTGVKRSGHLGARNIALPEKAPDWRVAEHELIRWMKKHGFVFSVSGNLLR